MAKILIQNINQGGIADSDYVGGKNSVAEMVGLDIHSESGVIKVNGRAFKETGTTIDAFVCAMVNISSLEIYAFGSTNGKIWLRDFSGWSLAATHTAGKGILNAKLYKGYIYYCTYDSIGRWQVGTAWSTRTDNWAYFTNTVSGNKGRPMRIVNDVLYIGDKNLVAQVDSGTFSANALDIDEGYDITALGSVNTDLLIGASNGLTSRAFRWNTWSVSYSYSDPIPETSINCFLDTDNNVLAQCGNKGRIYAYNGAQLEQYRRVKGVYTGTRQGYCYQNATHNFNGLPLFAMSNPSIQSNVRSCLMGIYSLGRTSPAYPTVLNLEYPISNYATLASSILGGEEIGAICPVDGNGFLVSWLDNNNIGGGGITYGIDSMIGANVQASAYLKTRVIMVNRTAVDTYGIVAVPYRSLPTGASIKIYKKVNNATTFTEITATVNDTKRCMVYTKADIGDASKVQFMVELTTSGQPAEVEMVEINIK